MRIVDLVCRQDPRHRLVLGLAAGGAVFIALRGHVRFSSAAIAGWNAFAAVILALDWLTILMTPQRKMRERAQQQDLSRLLIFLFVVFAACAVNRDFILDAGSHGFRFALRPRVLWG